MYFVKRMHQLDVVVKHIVQLCSFTAQSCIKNSELYNKFPQTAAMSKLSDQTDDEILPQLNSGALKHYTLERELDPLRAVSLRQQHLLSSYPDTIRSAVPYKHYPDYQVRRHFCIIYYYLSE